MDDLRDRIARALAQAIYKRDDPSWPLLEVCQPYADAVMAVIEDEAIDPMPDGELPGMWEAADLIGGATDAEEAAALDHPTDTTGETETP